MKKLNKILKQIKKEHDSMIYSIPGWDKTIVQYSKQFISGIDPKVKKVKNGQIDNQ